MARLLIPTRNRPASLAGVLGFLDRFSPGARVIVADGSTAEYGAANQAAADGCTAIEVDYRRYPYEMGFFPRILDVLEHEPDACFIMGSDDDFPLLDVLADAERELLADPELATVLGASIKLTLTGPAKLQAQLNVARPLLDARPEQRAATFAAWSFPTTYAVTRREVLIDRYRQLNELFLTGFVDFTIGIRDCLRGKVGAIPDIGYIRTANYGHSYLRPSSDLSFLERGADVLGLAAAIERDLVEIAGLEPKRAHRQAEQALRHRIAELCGRHRQSYPVVGPRTVAADPVLAAQYAAFGDLFRPGTALRARREEQLVAISRTVRATAESGDNQGEAARVETLDVQAAGGGSAPGVV